VSSSSPSSSSVETGAGGAASAEDVAAERDFGKDPLTWQEIDARVARLKGDQAEAGKDPSWARMVAAVEKRRAATAASVTSTPSSAWRSATTSPSLRFLPPRRGER
jgi:hypothetical protein